MWQSQNYGLRWLAKEKEKVADDVGIGAIKYGFLKPARETDIYFDLDESLSLEGNSGPYLQYTYARTQSVLAKSERAKEQGSKSKEDRKWNINKEELSILRALPKFSEVVEQASEKYAPNLLCNYLFDLAQKYNAFYNKHKIIGSKEQSIRLAITAVAGQILKNGLTILGIATPARM